jgi:Uma2 family endonuclease
VEEFDEEEIYMTSQDYLSWPDSPRYELIDGQPYMLASPSPEHQAILGQLHVQFHALLKGKPCQVFISPLDVFLNENRFDDTVVQPDLFVVCDKNKITKKGCEGSPDLIIEIVSPSSGHMDRLIKHKRYKNAAAREYWIVDPETRIVEVHVLNDGNYIVSPYSSEEKVAVDTFAGCEIDLSAVFPPEEKVPQNDGPKSTEKE